ncbi:MAG: hypothetical protein HGA19_11325, partial [Oscillochloris sp.]|nr:hypothetical protein [Oscillochloris sp.]
VQSFTACASTASCLTPGQTLALSNGQNLALAWSASAATSGMTLDIYVQGTDGLHQLITHQDAGNALSLEGSTDWTIGLPSGSYTLTLQLEREGLAPVKVEQGVITISDTTAPAAPASFNVTADAAMALTATWDGTAAEADVAGYQVSVDGGEPMKVTGRLAQYVAYGLTSGAEHTISVAAYDMSGNLGGAATAKVKLSQLGVAAAWPFRDSVASNVQQVGASFSGSVKLIAMTVTDAQHAKVPGTITALTGETSVSQVVTRGATFTPTNGSLASGSYTATITAQDLVSGSTVTYSWSFNAIELRHMVYLPVIVR